MSCAAHCLLLYRCVLFLDSWVRHCKRKQRQHVIDQRPTALFNDKLSIVGRPAVADTGRSQAISCVGDDLSQTDVELWINNNPLSTAEWSHVTWFTVCLMPMSHKPLFTTYSNLTVDIRVVSSVITVNENENENFNGQERRSIELGVCPMQLFHFWSRDVHPVQNLLLCTKFHQNRMIFRWDMAIYRFSKWRPSAILESFYHHTRPPTKSLLLAAAVCQISCQSDTQRSSWIYSYLNFSHIWFEMPIQATKMGVLGDFGPLNVIIHHRDPKRHILA